MEHRLSCKETRYLVYVVEAESKEEAKDKLLTGGEFIRTENEQGEDLEFLFYTDS